MMLSGCGVESGRACRSCVALQTAERTSTVTLQHNGRALITFAKGFSDYFVTNKFGEAEVRIEAEKQ